MKSLGFLLILFRVFDNLPKPYAEFLLDFWQFVDILHVNRLRPLRPLLNKATNFFTVPLEGEKSLHAICNRLF